MQEIDLGHSFECLKISRTSFGVSLTAAFMSGRSAQEGKTMNKYSFELTFRLPRPDADGDDYADALYEAGCDDAGMATGRRGIIGLEFARRAPSAEDAFRTAVDDVRKAIRGAELVEVAPDLVSLTDLADIVGCSRQNMRKYAAGQMRSIRAVFPDPAFTGSPSLWHLAEVGMWLAQHTDLRPAPEVIEMSKVTARENARLQQLRVRRVLEAA